MRCLTEKALSTLILALPCSINAAPHCPEWVAKIISVQGKVESQIYSDDLWRNVNVGDWVCPGAIIRVAKLSRATLMLRNDAVLSLDQNTTLSLAEPDIKRVPPQWLIKMLDGFALFRSRASQNITVQTPFINAIHEGTEFAVSVDKQQAKILVLDGEVRGVNSAGQIHIKKGFEGVALKNNPPRVQSLVVAPQDAVQWALFYPPLLEMQGKHSLVLQNAASAFQSGDFVAALAVLDEVPSTQQTVSVLLFKATLLLSVGQSELVLPLIDKLSGLVGGRSSALALKSIMAVTKNQQQVALEYATEAVKLDPKSVAAQLALSYAEQSLFNIDAALLACLKATQLAPNNALAWARLAELQLSSGNQIDALISAETAQKLNPKLARTQIVLGFSELAKTDIAEAQQAFINAISLDSSDPLARLGLGLAKIRQGELEEGKQELEVAVSLDPNNAVIRSYLGKAYYELRNKDFAGKEFEIAKAMDARDPTPWFYDAILKQSTNQPVAALQDMQRAIELNDNRGVYRSKLLLDKDKAARQAGLGRIFNGLGFDDLANRLAMKSLADDPSNYSAHRLLSDSYAVKPRHEIARSSEYLKSQLLQPLSYNPVQPSLAYTDLNIIKGIGPAETTFNEYNRLFERNGVRFTSTGIVGSNSTFGDEAAVSGIHNKFAFSMGQLHYKTNGFRLNNDLKHDLYNVFAQYELSPAFNIQAEYRHRETEQGDLGFRGDFYSNFDPDLHRKLNQDSYRYGMKISPAQHSDLLFSFIHADRKEAFAYDNLQTSSNDAEAQYIFHNDFINFILGGGVYLTDNHRSDCGTDFCELSGYKTEQYFGYGYSNYKLIENLNVTVGLSFDHYKDDSQSRVADLNELNPKLGFIWKASDLITFRIAAFKTVKSAIIDNQLLQPIQIAGFNQFFDDLNGTVAWQYGVGMDTHFSKNVYLGIEAYKRDLKVPTIEERVDPITGDSLSFFMKPSEELYRLYFNCMPFTNWMVNAEFRFENYRSDGTFGFFPAVVQTAFVPTELRFAHPTGFFAALKGTYINQSNKAAVDDFTMTDDFDSEFYLVDTAIGYRFPKQYGLISLETKNLFDTSFRYRDRQFQMNEQRSPDFMPERTFFARVTLNF